MTFEQLTQQMLEEIQSHGHPEVETLILLERARGTRMRPWADAWWWETLPYGGGAPSFFEQERRRLVEIGVLPATEYDRAAALQAAESAERAKREHQEHLAAMAEFELRMRTRR